MPGTWSISTTLRNPERIKGFLKVLARFEGEVFDEETQSRFFKELIKTKQYKPNGLSEYYNNRYEEPGEFTEDELFDIIDQLKYKNKSFNDDKNKVLAIVWLNNIDTIIENWYQSLIPTNP